MQYVCKYLHQVGDGKKSTSFSGVQFILISKYTYPEAKRSKVHKQILLEYYALQNRLRVSIIFEGVHENAIDLQSVSNSFFSISIYIVFPFFGSTVNEFSILWYVMNDVTLLFKSAHKNVFLYK